MKNFMVLVVLAILLSGCATSDYPRKDSRIENPHANNAIEGVVAIGSAVACGKKWGPFAGIVCGAIGDEIVKSVLWKEPPPQAQAGNVIIIRDGARRYNPCPAHDENGSFVPEGYRRDYRSGGITREGCGEVRAEGSTFAAVYAQTSQVTQNAPIATTVVGPSIDDYLYDPMIHEDCRKGNPGRDSKCLLDKSVVLDAQQAVCDGIRTEIETGEKCPDAKQYNPGKWAGIYRRLGRDLRQEQNRLNRGG